MKGQILVVAGALLTLAVAGAEPADLATALVGGTVIDGTGAGPLRDAVVLIRGELGTIEAGKLADPVVLDADPLADIRNTRATHRVVKAGGVLDPGEIVRSLRERDRL